MKVRLLIILFLKFFAIQILWILKFSRIRQKHVKICQHWSSLSAWEALLVFSDAVKMQRDMSCSRKSGQRVTSFSTWWPVPSTSTRCSSPTSSPPSARKVSWFSGRSEKTSSGLKFYFLFWRRCSFDLNPWRQNRKTLLSHWDILLFWLDQISICWGTCRCAAIMTQIITMHTSIKR